MKFAALILDNTAHIFDVAHIAGGESFSDDALQYMAERMNVTGDVDGWHFADSLEQMLALLAERRIRVAA